MSFSTPKKPSRVTIYGSEKSNLAFPYSDIDLSISGDFLQYQPSIAFTFISEALTESMVCEEVSRLTGIRVPILKMRSVEEGYEDLEIEILSQLSLLYYSNQQYFCFEYYNGDGVVSTSGKNKRSHKIH